MNYVNGYRLLFLSAFLIFVLPEVASASHDNAVNQGEILRQKLINFEKAIISGDVVEINRLYDDFTGQLRLTEAGIGKVYGPKNRRGLIEITNASEVEKLKTAAYKEKAADAIYLGILDYYSDH